MLDGTFDDMPEDIRAAAADATARFGLRVELAVVPPLPDLRPDLAGAVRGCVAEALANVAKHAGTDRAVVFAEADAGRLVVSVSDEGVGFDPEHVTERGIAGSIRRRVDELGGSTSITARPGSGATASIDIPVEGP